MNRRQAKKVLDRVMREDGGSLRLNPWRPRKEAAAMRIIAKRWPMRDDRGAPETAWYALSRLASRAFRAISLRGGTAPKSGYGAMFYAWRLRGGK